MSLPKTPKPVYTTDHSSSVLQTHSWRTVANSAGYLAPHVKDNMTILDVGCGPGSITVDLARLVPHGHVTGVEYVPDPLEGARAFAASQNITNVSFQVADIHALPFPDNTFDIVHVHQVLQHIADPVQALREMRRVTKTGGGLVACRESASMVWYPPLPGLDAWRALTRNMATARGSHPDPGSYIHVWAEKAGFLRDDITTSAGTWCFRTDAEREYWGGSMQARMQSSGLATAALGEKFTTQEELQKIIDAWKQFREDKDAWFGLLHGEIICRKS
ncbi:Methyltransferase type 11 [Niveomyces insectorum RCEF 264]|uniref:Methyltransferase type 11 n=1 Tax=Niveomyces insectorum RCEF 264 TaxID=1081102 RepID=A0A167N9D8_9HYPO|nr:Methyltransferase type 11 [Niveomyces insectorum RCEF 264]